MEVKTMVKIGLWSLLLWACKENEAEKEVPVLREENSKTVSDIRVRFVPTGSAKAAPMQSSVPQN